MSATLLVITVLSVAIAATAGAYAWSTIRQERRRSIARVAALAAEIESSEGQEESGPVDSLEDEHLDFGPPLRVSRRWIGTFIAGGALMGGVGLALALAMSSKPADSRRQHGDSPAVELVALTHEGENERLTVRGVVRNPRDGIALGDVTAVISLFDQNGEMLTSGSGALTEYSLRPGAEAAFSVTIPRTAVVGRYRVSFMSGGRVLPHIDRRARH